jgi:hypothetical protein
VLVLAYPINICGLSTYGIIRILDVYETITVSVTEQSIETTLLKLF